MRTVGFLETLHVRDNIRFLKAILGDPEFPPPELLLFVHDACVLYRPSCLILMKFTMVGNEILVPTVSSILVSHAHRASGLRREFGSHVSVGTVYRAE